MTVRPERVPAEEVRRRMLDAGRDLAVEAGITLTIEQLRLEEVIQRARVPRSSVYRLWPYKDEYVSELLLYLAGPGNWFGEHGTFDPATPTVVAQIVTDNRHRLDSYDGRRAVLCEVVRVGAGRNYRAFSESPTWRLHMALVATLGSTRAESERRQIAAALEAGQAKSRDSQVRMFEYLKRTLGLRERDPARTIEHMILAGALMVQSLVLRGIQTEAAASGPGAAPADDLITRPVPGPGLDGSPAPWTLAAFCYLAILDGFLELDPDWSPPPEEEPELLLRAATGEFEQPVAEHRHAGGGLITGRGGLALADK